ncbi:MAG: S41 family peptidase [Bacteroidetes bacterium]|nr:S41 family peptidase [Bacteroidota bacterium]
MFTGVGIATAGIVLGMRVGPLFSSGDDMRSLKKLEDAYLMITQRYVEDVDASELTEAAIRAMLVQLDPHSVYIDPERMKAVNEEFDAGYEGIGISYELIPGPEQQDTLAVLNPIPGGPSDDVGILSGDRIIEINDSTSIGIDSEEVKQRLKGPKGTTVNVTVRRPGYADLLPFTIRRDKIPLYTLDASYMLDDETGYIRLNRFARTSHQEFRDALAGLQQKGMKRLVFDMRGNVGGYMDQAVYIADDFLPAGELIVSAKGRLPETRETHNARGGGVFETQPLIVLVDENSASATEIVAGALQDHDRAVIVGRRTFGKGLVQKQYKLNDGSALRVTISRYYTPSGRLIQTPYQSGDREGYYEGKHDLQVEDSHTTLAELIDHAPDSLKYHTDGGRVVLGGGGILPDYIVEPDTLSYFMQAIVGRQIATTFVRDWLDRKGPEFKERWKDHADEFVASFDIPDALIDELLEFAESKYDLTVTAGERTVAKPAEGLRFTTGDVAADRHLLAVVMKGRIATRIYDRSYWYPIYDEMDSVLQVANGLWNEAENMAVMN